MFIVPASTFDNVTGKFPIGFLIWDTDQKEPFSEIVADVYDKQGEFLQQKTFMAYDYAHYMNEWVKLYRGNKTDTDIIGKFPFKGNDFQNQNMIQIVMPEMVYNKEAGQFLITKRNVNVAAVYFAVKKVVPATWMNDRDQFLFPNDGWRTDRDFQLDCLVWTLFANNIQSKYGINNWIPFYEDEIGFKQPMSSHFMQDYLQCFMSGKVAVAQSSAEPDLFGSESAAMPTAPIEMSEQAQAVMAAGKAIWQHYVLTREQRGGGSPDAALYDIKDYFKGRKEDGTMNATSDDTTFNTLMDTLRLAMQTLAKEIEKKVYEYGFLR